MPTTDARRPFAARERAVMKLCSVAQRRSDEARFARSARRLGLAARASPSALRGHWTLSEIRNLPIATTCRSRPRFRVPASLQRPVLEEVRSRCRKRPGRPATTRASPASACRSIGVTDGVGVGLCYGRSRGSDLTESVSESESATGVGPDPHISVGRVGRRCRRTVPLMRHTRPWPARAIEGDRLGADPAARPEAIRGAESKTRIESASSSLPIPRATAPAPARVSRRRRAGNSRRGVMHEAVPAGLVRFSGVSNPKHASLWDFFLSDQWQSIQEPTANNDKIGTPRP
jgi:hypothetical protein